MPSRKDYICRVDTPFGELLKPYNQSEIARYVGVTRSRVSRWANGQGAPEVQHLPRLAEILRVDIATLARIISKEVA